VQLRELVVIKRNGRRVPFDRDKLMRSLSIALRKRPVEPERVEEMVSKIVRELESIGESEIASEIVGEAVMEHLRNLDDVADATDKAVSLIQAQVKKDKLNVTGPRVTVTTNWGDENYDFDVALPVDHEATNPVDPVKNGTGYAGKALVTSFTGPPAQLPVMRLALKAYAYTHGYLFDESSEGNGRFFDELTSTDATKAATDQQTFTVYLPVQI